MRSFKRAVYKVGLQEEIKQVSCNGSLNVDGKEGIYEVEISIGTDTGETGLRYDAFNIPDRFQLTYDGRIVADSKYVGGSLSHYKDALLATSNKIVPIFEYDGTQFIDTGRTESVTLNSNDIADGSVSEPTSGKGTLKFNKDKAEVTTMKLKVYGVLGSTIWNATPVCPNGFASTGGSVVSPSVRTYDLIYFSSIPAMSCEDFDQGTITSYYSTGNLAIGTKLYTDTQLTKLMPSGYTYLGRTIYEVRKGEIVDIYPCHKQQTTAPVAIPYYDLTAHWAGIDNKGDTYGVSATSGFTETYGRMLQRRQADGTIRETAMPSGTKITPDFIEDDIVASTVPLHQLTALWGRYQRIDRLLFVPSTDTPNLQWILLRGNQMNIPELDFTNCVDIKGIDTSICQLLSIKLPPRSEDAKNFFQYAYIGHFYGIRNVPTINNPPEVVDKIVERAFFSNVSKTDSYNTGGRYKDLITDPCNGHLYHGANKTLPYHVILARDRNWRVNHLSVEAFEVNLTNGAQTKPFDLYSSGTHHEIDLQLPDNPSWLTLDKDYFYGDTQNIQTVNITVEANTTGAPRSTVLRFRKLKTYDRLWEMHQAAEVIITQAG